MGKIKTIISVLNWNNAINTIECVKSLLAHVSLEDCKIIITDNNSVDNSFVTLKKAFPELDVLLTKDNLGYAGGHRFAYSFALRKFKFDVFWILNNDLTIRKDTLSSLLKSYEENRNAIFGSVVINNELEKRITWGGTQTMTSFSKLPGAWPIQDVGKTYERKYSEDDARWVIVLNGCSILLPRDILEKYGFISDDFFLYHEETDYCMHLYKNKVKSLVVPASVVVHDTSQTTKLFPEIQPVIAYYKKRNTRILLARQFKKKRYQFLKIDLKTNAFWVLGFNFLKEAFLSGRSHRFYEFLGIIHFYLGKKGKTLDPNKYLLS